MHNLEELHHVDRSFMVLVTHLNDLLMAARGIEMKEYDVTATQARVLTLILHDEDKKQSISDIARILHRQPNGTATLVNRMIEKGLVVDHDNVKQKGNARYITITEKGRDIYNKTKDLVVITKILDVLPLEKKREICKAFVQVCDKAFEVISKDKMLPFSGLSI